MEAITDTTRRRALGNCFYLPISLEHSCVSELKAAISCSMHLEHATRLMLDGKLSFEDLLEYVEEAIPWMDTYVEQVEQNLESTLLFYPS